MRSVRIAAALLTSFAPCLRSAQLPVSPLDGRIDSVFAAFNHTSTPGCAVGADRAGAPIARRAYGMANIETATPFSLHLISESGSTAKQFVAAALSSSRAMENSRWTTTCRTGCRK
jgi:CubicO group peptidase (beta-lactamase class C family)